MSEDISSGAIVKGTRIGVPGGARALRPSIKLETPISEQEKAAYVSVLGAPKPPAPREDTRPVALVINDEPRQRELARAAYEGIGLKVFEAKDGIDGLRQAAARTTDLIFVELALPGLDGFRLIRGVRSYLGNMRAVICCLGSTPEPKDELAALGLGADDYILKPFTPERLRARARAIFRAKKSGL